MSKNKWICKNDKVLVITGNDKGKTGTVIARKEDKVIVQGINVRKRHVKRTQQTQGAQILSIERPIHISNVCLCDNDGNKIKVNSRLSKDKKTRELFYTKDKKKVVFRSIKRRG